MGFLDSALDTTLAGYSKVGFSSRGLSVDEQFPEVAGKHVMVTGATGGIGKAVAQRLAANGAVVHAVGRNAGKLEALVNETEGDVVPHQADLSSMDAIVGLADDYLSSGQPLHGLVNNVGIMIHERTVTDEGWEINRPIEYVHGNGGILTTVRDLTLWNQALTDGRLGGDEFLRLMHLQGRLEDGSEIVYAGGSFYTFFV